MEPLHLQLLLAENFSRVQTVDYLHELLLESCLVVNLTLTMSVILATFFANDKRSL